MPDMRATEKAKDGFDIEIFYDAECPVCKKEMTWLMRKQRANRVKFTTIQSVPGGVGEKTMTDLMQHMHGRLPDGTWIERVEVFRLLYCAIGLGWWVPISRLPIISHALEGAYDVFARNRLRLSGRCASGACGLQEKQEI